MTLLMEPTLETILCTQCGLCCDGSLFADVELSGAHEALRLEIRGLEIEDGDEKEPALLVQPCAALKRKKCSIYPNRPKCCRTFECLLLKRARHGEISVVDARQKISEALTEGKRVRTLLGRLPPTDARLTLKERCIDAIALAGEHSGSTEARRTSLELENAIPILERL